ncbi:cupin domain-containing protein [Dokdonella sp.]|uniref:cupin domain-containing protein n=1 Tax=Dokdonella sp. TaxID=2291710 RepID=UPI0031C2B4F4|nr:cupin domain-containing protein [Dokdonella sp.]
MHPRALQLIANLALAPHPEGGHYRRLHCSAQQVRVADGARDRPAMSAIHYLLAAGEVSRWHRVDADEAWHHAEGEALELFVFDAAADRLDRHVLGRFDPASGATPLVVVPAHAWQAARPLGAWALVGCSVAPAFEFAGFALLDAEPEVAARIAMLAPELGVLA